MKQLLNNVGKCGKSGKLAWEYVVVIVIVLMVVFVMVAFSIFSKEKAVEALGELWSRVMGR
ncbi:hypothetical protein DRN98_08840 [Methanosarcinales archaeon]|nr:MAG: hypothetical protein DRN98_08840 [Methanosarcinales archaeon]